MNTGTGVSHMGTQNVALERVRRALSRSASLFALVVLAGLTVGAQSFAPYAVFQAMTLDELQTLQVKLTYVGVQTRPTPSLAFTSTVHKLDLGAFVPFRRPGLSYANDQSAVRTFAASTDELHAVIQNVGGLPNVTAGGVAANPYLAFTLLNTVGGVQAFDATLNKADTADLFAQLRLALSQNEAAMRRLAEMACTIGVLDPGRPTDVSAGASVVIGGPRLNRQTGRFLAAATVTNKSGQSLPLPVSLVVDLEPRIRLFNADGVTCGTSPRGRPFIDLPLTGALPAGASATVTLDLENPDRLPLKFATKVLAGPGAR
jgi:hypothetical protein